MSSQFLDPQTSELFARKIAHLDAYGIDYEVSVRRPGSPWVQVTEMTVNQ